MYNCKCIVCKTEKKNVSLVLEVVYGVNSNIYDKELIGCLKNPLLSSYKENINFFIKCCNCELLYKR